MPRVPPSIVILDEMRKQHLPSFPKLATDSKKTFEENFHMLAQSILQERFPKLLQYDLGFQLIDKAEDNTRALGIRAFRLRTLTFMPFFYDGGQVYGYELLYLPKLNLFLPSIDEWVTYLTQKDVVDFGTPTEQRYGEQSYPDLIPLRRPYMFGTKMSAARQRGQANGKLLPYAIKHYKLAQAFIGLLHAYPKLLPRICREYGESIVKRAQNYAKQAPYIPRTVLPTEYQEKRAALRFYTADDNLDFLTPQEVDIVMRRGYLVKDARPKEILSQVTQKPLRQIFTTATTPGFYKVLDDTGDQRKVLIFPRADYTAALYTNPRAQSYIIVSTKGEGIVFDPLALPGGVPVLGRLPDEEFAKRLDDLPTKSVEQIQDAVRNHERLGIIDSFGKAIVTRLSDQFIHQPENQHLQCYDIPAGRMVILPKEYRVVRISDEDPPFRVAGWDKVNGMIFAAGEELKVIPEGNELIINNVRFTSKLGALRHLMYEYVLSERDAKNILKTAELSNGKVRFIIKRADSWVIRDQEKPVAVFPSDQWTMFAPGHLARQPVEAEYFVPGLKRPKPFVNQMEPPPAQVLQTLQQIADTYDGEVFDLSLVTSLLHTTQDEGLIEKFLPKLILGLDALGRVLFILYRHKQKMQERYGSEDYAVLVDTVKVNLQNLGKLIMSLSQRQITPILHTFISDVTHAEADVEAHLE